MSSCCKPRACHQLIKWILDIFFQSIFFLDNLLKVSCLFSSSLVIWSNSFSRIVEKIRRVPLAPHLDQLIADGRFEQNPKGKCSRAPFFQLSLELLDIVLTIRVSDFEQSFLEYWNTYSFPCTCDNFLLLSLNLHFKLSIPCSAVQLAASPVEKEFSTKTFSQLPFWDTPPPASWAPQQSWRSRDDVYAVCKFCTLLLRRRSRIWYSKEHIWPYWSH